MTQAQKALSAVLVFVLGCDDAGTSPLLVDAAAPVDAASPAQDAAPSPRAHLAHTFEPYPLDGFGETTRCVKWTLDNDHPLYVEAVRFDGEGAFHHSNWFVVPEDEFPGPDGYYRCAARGFDEFRAARAGTVLFAQSTQSRTETQRLGVGRVIKVPPRSAVAANVHLLNLSSAPVAPRMRLALAVVHPAEVDVVVTPFRLSYLDLDIPARSRARFTGVCDLATPYAQRTGGALDALELYWALPHYHALGDLFELAVVGGPRDGELLYQLETFNAEANGQAFDPPASLAGATGLRFTCGFDNPRARPVGWGVGDQEMCVMLGFANAELLIDMTVPVSGARERREGDTVYREGPCRILLLPKSEDQQMPTAEELEAPLRVPRTARDTLPEGLSACVDTPDDAEAIVEPTVESLRSAVFLPSCSFSACHGARSPAAGLDLTADDLHAELLGHAVQSGDGPLVAPGDPGGSALYRRLSRCATEGPPHMPLNAPTLLEPGLVAAVRDWIAAGAR